MKITILCSDKTHPIYPFLLGWKASRDENIVVLSDLNEVETGNILFLISCHSIVGKSVRSRFDHTLVVHASDLPKGRGWSPLVHEILGGSNRICVTLLAAEDAVDSGDIWAKRWIAFDGTELHEEIHTALSLTTLTLMDFAIAEALRGPSPEPQTGEPSFYPKRSPADSEISASDRIEDVFDLLRIADNERYPVHFEHRGRMYRLALSLYDT